MLPVNCELHVTLLMDSRELAQTCQLLDSRTPRLRLLSAEIVRSLAVEAMCRHGGESFIAATSVSESSSIARRPQIGNLTIPVVRNILESFASLQSAVQ
jgi:hypothetical protein